MGSLKNCVEILPHHMAKMPTCLNETGLGTQGWWMIILYDLLIRYLTGLMFKAQIGPLWIMLMNLVHRDLFLLVLVIYILMYACICTTWGLVAYCWPFFSLNWRRM